VPLYAAAGAARRLTTGDPSITPGSAARLSLSSGRNYRMSSMSNRGKPRDGNVVHHLLYLVSEIVFFSHAANASSGPGSSCRVLNYEISAGLGYSLGEGNTHLDRRICYA
jgi:hypothetical protein